MNQSVDKKAGLSTGQRKGVVQKYLEEIVDFAPLPPAEEIELTRKIRRGDSGALDKLVKANLRFVISVAKQYQGRGLSLEDLISEGNLGLMKAAERFDETRGFKFISYAVWWIRQSIMQALSEHSRMVRLPMNRVGAIRKIGRVVENLQKDFEREPSLHEVAESLGMNDAQVDLILKTAAPHLSLDKPFQPGDGSRLLDILEDSEDTPADALFMKESLKAEIKDLLVSLKPRETEVIKLYFGLVGERALTLEEIGESIQLTRERVRQIKEKALRRMRVRARSEPLQDFLG